MDDTSKTLRRWVAFAGCVLVVVVLYWAQTVLVPIALAILLTFMLSPPVTWLERWIGRIPAVLAMVSVVFSVLGLAGWGLARQMDYLADDLPRYRVNILAKIADVRGAGKGGSVEKLQDTIEAGGGQCGDRYDAASLELGAGSSALNGRFSPRQNTCASVRRTRQTRPPSPGRSGCP